MSVWISDEKLLIFASLISPSKMILFEKKYQTFDTLFYHQMKHLEVRQKYSAARRIFNSLLGVSSGDETLRLMIDILHEQFVQVSGLCGPQILSYLPTLFTHLCRALYGDPIMVYRWSGWCTDMAAAKNTKNTLVVA